MCFIYNYSVLLNFSDSIEDDIHTLVGLYLSNMVLNDY